MPDAPNRPHQADSREAAALDVTTAILPGPSRWTALLDWFDPHRRRRRWRGAFLAAGTCYQIVVKLPWLAAIVLIAVLLVQGLTQRTTAIDPLSVPKTLAESGYTPEVAAQRLRDALGQFAGDAEKELKSSTISLRAELPNIVVPTVGLSLDAITSSVRTFFGSARRRTISGEFTVKDNLLWLRLRIDGQEQYNSLKGVHPEKPDELLADAASAIFDGIQPYFVAAWHRYRDPATALELADKIIARLPDSDENVAWLYDLKGAIYLELHDSDKAMKELEKAIQFNPRIPFVHRDVGWVLYEQKKYDGAMAAFRRALRLDPKDAFAQCGVGDVYLAQKKYDEATAAYRKAIALNPKFPVGHAGLGDVFVAQKKYDEAAAAYRESTRVDPKYVGGRIGAASMLYLQGRNDEAIAVAHEAIRLEPKNAFAHFLAGVVLHAQNKPDEAIAEYRDAARLNPNLSEAHNGLGVILLNRGMREEAIAEFREAIRADADNVTARKNLDAALN
jgi:tetratricopeptide (TPR) repeat protein